MQTTMTTEQMFAEHTGADIYFPHPDTGWELFLITADRDAAGIRFYTEDGHGRRYNIVLDPARRIPVRIYH